MNEIKIFNNPEFGQIRTTTDEQGEPLFCLKDVCDVLGLPCIPAPSAACF